MADSLLLSLKLCSGTAMVVTTVSIRLALKRIAEITCGTAPKVIHVKALGDPTHRVFAVSIPWEYRTEVLSYVAQHLSIFATQNILIHTPEQATAVMDLVIEAADNSTS